MIIRRTTAPIGRYSWQSTYRRSCTKVFLDKHYRLRCCCLLIEYPYSLYSCGSDIREIYFRHTSCGKGCSRSRWQGCRISSIGRSMCGGIAIICSVSGNLHTRTTITIVLNRTIEHWLSYRRRYLHRLLPFAIRIPSGNLVPYHYYMGTRSHCCKKITRHPATCIQLILILIIDPSRYIGHTYLR